MGTRDEAPRANCPESLGPFALLLNAATGSSTRGQTTHPRPDYAERRHQFREGANCELPPVRHRLPPLRHVAEESLPERSASPSSLHLPELPRCPPSRNPSHRLPAMQPVLPALHFPVTVPNYSPLTVLSAAAENPYGSEPHAYTRYPPSPMYLPPAIPQPLHGFTTAAPHAHHPPYQMHPPSFPHRTGDIQHSMKSEPPRQGLTELRLQGKAEDGAAMLTHIGQIDSRSQHSRSATFEEEPFVISASNRSETTRLVGKLPPPSELLAEVDPSGRYGVKPRRETPSVPEPESKKSKQTPDAPAYEEEQVDSSRETEAGSGFLTPDATSVGTSTGEPLVSKDSVTKDLKQVSEAEKQRGINAVESPKGTLNEENDEEETRCPCNSVENEGFMIACDECDTWQHGKCMGFRRRSEAPEKYSCHLCRPDEVRKACAAYTWVTKRRESHYASLKEVKSAELRRKLTTVLVERESKKWRTEDDWLKHVFRLFASISASETAKDRHNVIEGLALISKLSRTEVTKRLETIIKEMHPSSKSKRKESSESRSHISRALQRISDHGASKGELAKPLSTKSSDPENKSNAKKQVKQISIGEEQHRTEGKHESKRHTAQKEHPTKSRKITRTQARESESRRRSGERQLHRKAEEGVREDEFDAGRSRRRAHSLEGRTRNTFEEPLSREERKIRDIMKQFERLEQKQQRKKGSGQPGQKPTGQKSVSQDHSVSSIGGTKATKSAKANHRGRRKDHKGWKTETEGKPTPGQKKTSEDNAGVKSTGRSLGKAPEKSPGQNPEKSPGIGHVRDVGLTREDKEAVKMEATRPRVEKTVESTGSAKSETKASTRLSIDVTPKKESEIVVDAPAESGPDGKRKSDSELRQQSALPRKRKLSLDEKRIKDDITAIKSKPIIKYNADASVEQDVMVNGTCAHGPDSLMREKSTNQEYGSETSDAEEDISLLSRRVLKRPRLSLQIPSPGPSVLGSPLIPTALRSPLAVYACSKTRPKPMDRKSRLLGTRSEQELLPAKKKLRLSSVTQSADVVDIPIPPSSLPSYSGSKGSESVSVGMVMVKANGKLGALVKHMNAPALHALTPSSRSHASELSQCSSLNNANHCVSSGCQAPASEEANCLKRKLSCVKKRPRLRFQDTDQEYTPPPNGPDETSSPPPNVRASPKANPQASPRCVPVRGLRSVPSPLAAHSSPRLRRNSSRSTGAQSPCTPRQTPVKKIGKKLSAGPSVPQKEAQTLLSQAGTTAPGPSLAECVSNGQGARAESSLPAEVAKERRLCDDASERRQASDIERVQEMDNDSKLKKGGDPSPSVKDNSEDQTKRANTERREDTEDRSAYRDNEETPKRQRLSREESPAAAAVTVAKAEEQNSTKPSEVEVTEPHSASKLCDTETEVNREMSPLCQEGVSRYNRSNSVGGKADATSPSDIVQLRLRGFLDRAADEKSASRAGATGDRKSDFATTATRGAGATVAANSSFRSTHAHNETPWSGRRGNFAGPPHPIPFKNLNSPLHSRPSSRVPQKAKRVPYSAMSMHSPSLKRYPNDFGNGKYGRGSSVGQPPMGHRIGPPIRSRNGGRKWRYNGRPIAEANGSVVDGMGRLQQGKEGLHRRPENSPRPLPGSLDIGGPSAWRSYRERKGWVNGANERQMSPDGKTSIRRDVYH